MARTPPKYDWDAVRRSFIEAEPEALIDLKKVAEQHGIPHQTVRLKASREQWDTQRLLFQQRAETARRQQRADLMGANAAEIDATLLRAADMGVRLVRLRLNTLAKESTQAKDGVGLAQLDSLELTRLGYAARIWGRIAHEAMGDPDRIQHDFNAPQGSVAAEQALRAGLDLARLATDDIRALRTLIEKATADAIDGRQIDRVPDRG